MNYGYQQPRATQTVRVAKLILMETGTYNPMFSRPYETYIDSQSLDNITRRVSEANGATITGSLLSGLASNIVKPSTSPQGQIAIPQGWSERRIRFMLEVHVTTSTGSDMIYYFQGYTSHLGVAANGAVDPRMEFIINSFIRVTRAQQQTAYGIQIRDIVTESAHIINGNIINQATGVDAYTMRPSDIFTGIQSNYLSNAYNYYDKAGGFNDTRVKVGNELVRSNRINNLPCNYIAKVVDDYQTGLNLAEYGQGLSDIYTRCRGLSTEASPYENPFIRAISNIRGIQAATSFTFDELQRIDPNAPNVTNHFTLGSTQISQLPSAGQTAYWNSVDNETLIATTLSNAVPAIMMELMISKIYFRSTNHDIGGVMNTVIIDAKSLTNADLSVNFEMFKKRLEREALFDITYGNQELYMLEMNADLFGDTRISVSFGNGPMITYTTPSFCDSLLTPVVSMNKDNFFKVVHDFEVLMNNVNDNVTKTSPINTLV